WGYQAIKIDNNSTSATLTLNGNVAADRFNITSEGANLKTLTINGDLKYSSASNYDQNRDKSDEVNINLRDAALGTNIKLGGLKVGQGTVQITGSQGKDTIELAKGINMDRIHLNGYNAAVTNATKASFEFTASAATTAASGNSIKITFGTASVTLTGANGAATADFNKAIEYIFEGKTVADISQGGKFAITSADITAFQSAMTNAGVTFTNGGTDGDGKFKLEANTVGSNVTVPEIKLEATGATVAQGTSTPGTDNSPAKNATSYITGLDQNNNHYEIQAGGDYIDVVKNFQLKYDNIDATVEGATIAVAGSAAAVTSLAAHIRFLGVTASGDYATNKAETGVFTLRTDLTGADQQAALNAITLGDMLKAADEATTAAAGTQVAFVFQGSTYLFIQGDANNTTVTSKDVIIELEGVSAAHINDIIGNVS
ncbi:hypothetical protein CCZ01_09710, partial [Helicobacter monodelphidis]|uniref:hypothetical protein n=1 Tax=Helicobacter sp. 15-1451 TaxID=2004995 RepID=UPI000DCF43B6